jgi:uncharacterized membrane protein
VAQEADGFRCPRSRLTKTANLIWRGRREAVFLFAVRGPVLHITAEALRSVMSGAGES